MRIDTLERIWPPDDWAARAAIPDEAWQAAARALAPAGLARRLAAQRAAARPPDRRRRRERTVEVRHRAAAPATHRRRVVVAGDVAHVDVAGRSVAFRLAAAPDVDRAARAAPARATAAARSRSWRRCPGSILAVHVAVGETVDAGDPIVTLEAMKMEHAVVAPIAGHGRRARRRARATRWRAGDVLAVVEP